MSKTHPTRATDARKRDTRLTEAKLALVAAHERGDREALAHALREHPAHADALTEFELSLLATSGYTDAEANANANVDATVGSGAQLTSGGSVTIDAASARGGRSRVVRAAA